MIMEGLVVAACFAGNNEACSTSLTEYAKFHKLDVQAQVVEQNIKKRYPAAHFMGTTAAMIVHRQYNFMLYRNIWYNGDYMNTQNPTNKIVYKYEF